LFLVPQDVTNTDTEMRSEFVFMYRDWLNAALKAFDTKIDSQGKPLTETVDFEVSPPDDGQFRLSVKSEDRTVLSIPIYDSHPPFHNIYQWMDRVGEYLSNGEKVPESVGIDCIDYNIIMTVVHIGFSEFRYKGETMHGPVSFLTIYRSGSKEMAYSCFCSTDELLSNLHNSVIDAFCRFSVLFNDSRHWSMVPDFSGKHVQSPAERLVKELFSMKIARIFRH